MKVAVAVKGSRVSGPGEGDTVRIYEVLDGYTLLEEYENPATRASVARGVHMLRSALESGAEAFVLAEIGEPGMRFVKGKAKVYLPGEIEVRDALELLQKGKLTEARVATHPGHAHMLGTEWHHPRNQ